MHVVFVPVRNDGGQPELLAPSIRPSQPVTATVRSVTAPRCRVPSRPRSAVDGDPAGPERASEGGPSAPPKPVTRGGGNDKRALQALQSP